MPINPSALQAAALRGKIPGNTARLDQTLQGIQVATPAAGLPPDLAAVVAQMQPPAQEEVNRPGVGRSLAAAILGAAGTGLTGDPRGGGADVLRQVEARAQAAEQRNREALEQYNRDRLDFITSATQEARRRAERGEDLQTAADKTKFEQEMERERLQLDRDRLALLKAERDGKLSQRQRLDAQTSLMNLLADASDLRFQLSQLRQADPDAATFVVSTPAGRQFDSTAAIRATYREAVADIIARVESPEMKADLQKRFDRMFKSLLEPELAAFEKKTEEAAKPPPEAAPKRETGFDVIGRALRGRAGAQRPGAPKRIPFSGGL